MIPGANLLTDVTTENPVSDRGANVTRDRPFQFDGQIRDAAAPIHHRCTGFISPKKRSGRTHNDTRLTRSTPVGLERQGDIELDVDHQESEQDVRSPARMDQHRVAPEPTEPGSTSEFSLEDRGRINQRPSSDTALNARVQPGKKLL